MIAVALLFFVIVDTAISGYLLARVRQLQTLVAAQAKLISDVSDSLSDSAEGDDGE